MSATHWHGVGPDAHAPTDADGRRRLADLLAHARLAAFVAAPLAALGLLVWAALAGGPT